MDDFADVVIIGSGFGGAVLAARLGAELGDRVMVLEKGDDPTGRFDPGFADPDATPLNAQDNRFRHSLAPGYLDRLVDVFTDVAGTARDGAPSLNVLAGKGFGGGSNVYAGVSLRAPRAAFEQREAERRLWPTGYSREALDPHYAEVERQLKVNRLAWTDAQVPHWQLATQRDFVFAEGCRRIGATALPLKLASDNDANEGWWSQGQRFAGRQNLTQNYLQQALDAGVQFRAGVEIERFEPIRTGYALKGVRRQRGTAVEFEMECRLLVVAAGAIGSTGLLLRSEDAFDGERALDQGREQTGRRVLGRGLSGNGDYGVTGIVGPDFEWPVETFKSKPIGSVCPSFFAEHGFLVLPFYAEPLYLSLGRISTLLRADNPTAAGRRSTTIATGERDWGVVFKQRLKQFGSRMLSMGCLAYDEREGEIVLNEAGAIEVRWPTTSRATEDRWAKAIEVMGRIYDALGGEMYLDNYRKDGTVNTSHPLGGCRMAEAPTDGIVDPFGEAWGNPNLFIVDGAVIPSALVANPSLTIAAVAERIADRVIRGDGTAALVDRLIA